MRVDHIEQFNLACADVVRLAAGALAEHARQVAELEGLLKQADAFAASGRADPEPGRPSATFAKPPVTGPQADRVATGSEASEPASDASDAVVTMARIAATVRADEAECGPSEAVGDILRLAMDRVDADDNPVIAGGETGKAASDGSQQEHASSRRPVTRLSDIAFNLVDRKQLRKERSLAAGISTPRRTGALI